MIDCQTAIENLYRFLDRDLAPDEYEEIQHHLEKCPPCAEYFRFEEGVLRLVGDSCRKDHAPESLLARIRELRERQPYS